jgi:uncharacterized protein (TIGR02145 family)
VPCPNAPYASTWTLTDTRDNKNYRVVKMPDGRVWMGQNLNYHGVAYTCHSNVAANCDNGYGALYCYDVATATGFCPSGWHLPTDTEWGAMLDAVEGSGNAHVNCPPGNVPCGTNAGRWLKATTEWPSVDVSGSPYNDTFKVLKTGWQYGNSSQWSWGYKGTHASFMSQGESHSTTCARSFIQGINGAQCGILYSSETLEYCGAVRCLQD